MYLLSPKLPFSWRAVICSRLPLPVARAITAVMWAIPYCLNTQQLRSTIAPSVAKATGTKGLRKHFIGMSGAIAFGRYISNFAFFLHRPAAEISKRVNKRTEFGDAEQLVRHHQAGRGAILVSSNFSCFYYALATALSARDFDVFAQYRLAETAHQRRDSAHSLEWRFAGRGPGNL